LKISLLIADFRRDLFEFWLRFIFSIIISRMTKLMLRDFKNESLFFKMNSCLFFTKREIIEIVTIDDAERIVKIETIRNAKKIMKMTRTTNESWCAESSLFSIAFVCSMMKSSTEILLFVVDVIACRLDFFAFIVAYMTRIDWS
jgi:hypothetical protein